MSKTKSQLFLENAQETLGIGPVEMARLLDTNFNTYKAWLYGKNPMPGVTRVAIECLMANRTYAKGVKFATALNAGVRQKHPD